LTNITISRYCCVYWRNYIIIYWYNTTGWTILNTEFSAHTIYLNIDFSQTANLFYKKILFLWSEGTLHYSFNLFRGYSS